MRAVPEGGPGRLAVAALALAAAVLPSLWAVLGRNFITSYDDEPYVTGKSHVQRGLAPNGIR